MPPSASSGPDFIIAGAARSGTSALARYLDAQDGVSFSKPKETHFLAHANERVAYGDPGADHLINDHAVTDPDAWFAIFDALPAGLKGEGSVSTLAFPDASLPNIERYCPADVKVIVCLREPVARMHSSWLYLHSRGQETIDDFEDALAAEPTRTADNWHHMWRYRALSTYGPQLDAFIDALGRDRVHIVIAERLDGLDSPEFAAVATFLNIDLSDQGTEFGEINRGGVPNQSPAARLVMALQKSSALVDIVRRLIPIELRERMHSRLFDRPELDDDLWQRLHPEWESTIAAVEAHVGPIPEWRRPPSMAGDQT